MQSEVVYSLNHDLTASLVLDHTLNFPKIHLNLHGYQHKGAPISPSTAYKGAETLYIYNMEVGCRVRWFTASTMTLQHHWCLTVPSIFQKSTTICTDISIRVHPYPYPQHIKVLKHFIYIIWRWDAE
jgi:hypothetical protein